MTLEVLSSLPASNILYMGSLFQLATEAQHAKTVIEDFYTSNPMAPIFFDPDTVPYENGFYTASFNMHNGQLHIVANGNGEWFLNCDVDTIYSCYRAEYNLQNKIPVQLTNAEKQLTACAPVIRHWVARLEELLAYQEESIPVSTIQFSQLGLREVI